MKMVLVDYNQAMIASVTTKGALKEVWDDNFLRHSFLTRVLQIVRKFKNEGYRIIFCKDDENIWRKEFFPFYKAKRRIDKEASRMDWKALHRMMNIFFEELSEHFPYTMVKAAGAEGDDIIAYLLRKYHDGDPVVILSSDMDFIQLHSIGDNIHQWSIMHGNYIKNDNPDLYLKEMIIRGQISDGIPNILSDDNVFISPDKRQATITKKKMNEWLEQPVSVFCSTPTMIRNWDRNSTLMDLKHTPIDIINRIEESFANQRKGKGNLFDYMFNTGTTNFMENIQEFR